MKILIISNVFPPGFIGGYELGALDIAKGLYNNGHEIQVLTSNYFWDEHEELKFLNVSRSLLCPTLEHQLISPDHVKQRYYDFQNIRILGNTIRQFKPDITLAFNLFGLGSFSIIQYLQKISLPTVLYLMDNIFWETDLQSPLHLCYEQLFGRLKFNKFTHIVAMSENLVREVNHTLNVTLEQVTYIPGWVDFRQFPIPQIVLHEKEMTHFVFCSRIDSHKGVDIMLDAAEKLVHQGFTHFIIDVYGAGRVAIFLQKIKAKNLEKYIEYKGALEKYVMLPTLSHYDALLFPTWEREPFGFVASEAAIMGCFPIMTSGIGASEWFLDGYDCFKISRDATSLSMAMQRVMLWSDEERKKNRHNALISSRNNFDFNRWLPMIEKICFNMAAIKKPQNDHRVTKGVESAFLFLSSLLADKDN